LNTLGQMFQQQAEMRMALIPVILAPALIVFTALFIGFVIVAMFAPMIALIQSVSGPVSYHSWFH
jgi:type II secretory pathway component PulF